MANLSHLPDAWRQSGLSQRAFCEREDISLATFSYWRGKELRGEQQAASAPAFTEVIVQPQCRAPGEAPAIEITYPDGTRVRIPTPTLSSPVRC